MEWQARRGITFGDALVKVIADKLDKLGEKPARKKKPRRPRDIPMGESVVDGAPGDPVAAGAAALDGATPVYAPPIDAVAARRMADGTMDGGLPADCPVIPLGKNGDVFFYVDAQRQYRHLKARDHNRLNLQALVAPKTNWLWDKYPRYNKDGDKTGWHAELFAEDLMNNCAQMPAWEARARLRGRGAWRGDGNELVMHLGDQVLVRRTDAPETLAHDPGLIGWYVYPGSSPLPRPADDDKALAEGVGEVMSLFGQWSWRQSDEDRKAGRHPHSARLLLGWIICGLIGGALEWRPMIWVTAPFGSGKSTLQECIDAIFGKGGILRASDATSAGVRQVLGLDTLSVLLDENEGSADNSKINALVQFARLAASGGRLWRGGGDHEAVEFVARSCFAFSSIIVPPLTPQDRSRIAVLDLDKLAQDATEPVIDPDRLAAIGGAMRRRLLDGWPDFLDRIASFKGAMRRLAGHTSRSASQYGTLLAAADFMLNGEAPAGDDAWREALRGFSRADLAFVDDEEGGDGENCLSHLLTSLIDLGRGSDRRTVAGWVDSAFDGKAQPDTEKLLACNKVLGTFGLKVIDKGAVPGETWWLAVANRHTMLGTLFDFSGSPWATPAGQSGAWARSLQRVDGHQTTGSMRFDGAGSRATLIPVSLCVQTPTLGKRAE